MKIHNVAERKYLERGFSKGGSGLLTEMQRRFIEAFRVSGDAPKAAVEAGYSPGRARRQAAALLKKPEIALALEAARAREAEDVSITRIRRELARIAFEADEVRDGDRLRALEMLTKLLPPAEDDDGPACGVVILPEAAGE